MERLTFSRLLSITHSLHALDECTHHTSCDVFVKMRKQPVEDKAYMKGYPKQISNNIIREVESSGDYLFDLPGRREGPSFSGKKVIIMICYSKIVRKKLTAGDGEELLSKPDPSLFFITVGTIATYLTTLAYKAEYFSSDGSYPEVTCRGALLGRVEWKV